MPGTSITHDTSIDHAFGVPSQLADALDIGTLDIEQLEQLRINVLEQIRAIEGQMSNPDRRNAFGQRLQSQEYWQWRTRARRAWQARQAEYMRVRQRITELRRLGARRPQLDRGEPEQLLAELCTLVRTWVGEGLGTPRTSELDLINRVSARLGRDAFEFHGGPAA
jgi:hypothetical protein